MRTSGNHLLRGVIISALGIFSASLLNPIAAYAQLRGGTFIPIPIPPGAVPLAANGLEQNLGPAGQKPQSLESLRQQKIDELHRESMNIPSIGVHDMQDVALFTLRNGELECSSSIPPSTPPNPALRTLQIAGKPWICQLTVISLKNAPQLAMGPRQMVIFLSNDISEPGAVDVLTQILSGPGSLQVARDIERPGDTQSITLIERLYPSGIQLRVQDIDERTGRELHPVVLSARNFVELKRRYPRETNQYLRDIFRDLGQESSVMAVDRARAWQVLSADAAVDPTLETPIAAILQELDSDNFPQRQAAMDNLQHLGDPAALILMRADRSNWSENQRAEVDAFLAPFCPMSSAEATRLHDDPDFLLDCMFSDDRSIRVAALARLTQIAGHPIALDIDAPEVQRDKQIDALRQIMCKPPTPADAPTP